MQHIGNYGHFAYRTLRLLDSSPTVWSFRLLDTLPTGHIAYEDISCTGQFAHWTIRLLVISVRRQIAYLKNFANKTTRIKSNE